MRVSRSRAKDGLVMERGGYGLRWDIILGVVGSTVGSWIFLALGISPEAGMVTMAVVAFVGAAIPIVAQRKVLAHHRLRT
jgi:uncharacterized membrane protein YeaQ/YmgE (transglycosylase-associated protein family)